MMIKISVVLLKATRVGVSKIFCDMSIENNLDESVNFRWTCIPKRDDKNISILTSRLI